MSVDATVAVVQAGEWLPAEELRRSLAERLLDRGSVLIDCEGIADVNACSLQLLLSFVDQRRKTGGTVALRHVSTGLAQWFGYAGAASLTELACLAQEA